MGPLVRNALFLAGRNKDSDGNGKNDNKDNLRYSVAPYNNNNGDDDGDDDDDDDGDDDNDDDVDAVKNDEYLIADDRWCLYGQKIWQFC